MNDYRIIPEMPLCQALHNQIRAIAEHTPERESQTFAWLFRDNDGFVAVRCNGIPPAGFSLLCTARFS